MEDNLEAVRAAVLRPQLSYRTLGDDGLTGTKGRPAEAVGYATIDNDLLRRRPGDAPPMNSSLRGAAALSALGVPRPRSSGSGAGTVGSDFSENTSVGGGSGTFLPTQAVERVVAFAALDGPACLQSAHVNRQWRRCVQSNAPLWRAAFQGRTPPGWDCLRQVSHGARGFRGLRHRGAAPSSATPATPTTTAEAVSVKALASTRRRDTAGAPPASHDTPRTAGSGAHFVIPVALRSPVTTVATMPLGTSAAVMVLITGHEDGSVEFHLASDLNPAAPLCTLTPQALRIPRGCSVTGIVVAERGTSRWVAVSAGDAVCVLEFEKVSAFDLDPASLKTLRLRPCVLAAASLPMDAATLVQHDGGAFCAVSLQKELPTEHAAARQSPSDITRVVVHPRLPLVATLSDDGRVWLWDIQKAARANGLVSSRPSTPGMSASSASTMTPSARSSLVTTPSAGVRASPLSVEAMASAPFPPPLADLAGVVSHLDSCAGGAQWGSDNVVLSQNTWVDGEFITGTADGKVLAWAWRGGSAQPPPASPSAGDGRWCHVRSEPRATNTSSHRHGLVAIQCDTAQRGAAAPAAAKLVATLCRGGVLAVHNAEDLTTTWATHRLKYTAPPTCLAFSHGYALAAAADGAVTLFPPTLTGGARPRARGGYSGGRAEQTPAAPLEMRGHAEAVTHMALHVLPSTTITGKDASRWHAVTAGSRGRVLLWGGSPAGDGPSAGRPLATLAEQAGHVSGLASLTQRRTGEPQHVFVSSAHRNVLTSVAFESA